MRDPDIAMERSPVILSEAAAMLIGETEHWGRHWPMRSDAEAPSMSEPRFRHALPLTRKLPR